MKIKLSRDDITNFIVEAQSGMGREVEIGGNNLQVDITILKDDLPLFPALVGGTARIFLNKYHKYIGHTVIAPKKK